jgi:uncharacterized protein YjiS (DUF1127 family)
LSSVCAEGRRQRRRPLQYSLLAIARSILMLVRLWRERSHIRRQLAVMSERELQDIGKCWPEIAYEASKPFWRK